MDGGGTDLLDFCWTGTGALLLRVGYLISVVLAKATTLTQHGFSSLVAIAYCIKAGKVGGGVF